MLRNNDNNGKARVSFWARNPLLPPATALCAGIWLSKHLGLNPTFSLVFAGILLLAAATIRALGLRRASIPLLLAIVTLGFARYHISLVPFHDPLPPDAVEGLLRGRVCEQPHVFQRQNRTKVVLNNCVFDYTDGERAKLPYKVQLNIKADTTKLWPMSSLKFEESDPRHFTEVTAGIIDIRRHLNYGDTLEAAVSLVTPSGVRNPGGFDPRQYYAQRGILRSAYCSSEAEVRVFETDYRSIFSNVINLLWSWRRNFRELLDDTCDADNVPMMKALILGDRTGITTDHYDQMQRIGVAHFIAISGLHVGFVALFFYWLFAKVSAVLGLSVSGTRGLRFACLATIGTVASYVVVANPVHATVRAGIIVLCYLVARAFDRDREFLNLLALAAIVILLWTPGAIFEAGFQLSFVAAMAITVTLKATSSKISIWVDDAAPRLPARVKEALRSSGLEVPFSRRFSIGSVVQVKMGSPLDYVLKPVTRIGKLMVASPVAVVSTAPLAAWWFGRISFVGLFANLYVVSIALLLVPLLLLGFVMSVVNTSIAVVLLTGADRVMWLMRRVNDWFSNGSLPTRLLASTPCIIAYTVFILFLLSLWFIIKRPGRKKLIAASLATGVGLALFGTLALTYGFWSTPKPSLVNCVMYYLVLIFAYFLLHKPSRKRAVATSVAAVVLILSVFLGAKWPSDLMRVAFLDVGHGLSCVVEAPGGKVVVIDGGGSLYGASEVGRQVLLPYLRHRGIRTIDLLILSNPHSERADGLLSLLREAGAGSLGGLEIGQVVLRDFGCTSKKYRKFCSAIAELDLPVRKIENSTGLSLQSFAENSLVVRLEFAEFSILFLSDAGRVSQLLLSEYGAALESTMLVIPEGYETSVSGEFMELVSPEALVVSGANQRWRKPKAPLLHYETAGRRILKTNESHYIIIESNGRGWRALAPFAEQSE